MNVSIIIPNYNGESLLKKNLQSIIEALTTYCEKRNTKGEVILVDDCSTDNSLSFMHDYQSSFKNKNIVFKVEESKKNMGFSSTVNRGVGVAESEIIVLLNTDTRPDSNFLTYLLPHFENENVFAVGCLDKSIEKGKIVLRGRGIGRWEKGFLMHSAGSVDKN